MVIVLVAVLAAGTVRAADDAKSATAPAPAAGAKLNAPPPAKLAPSEKKPAGPQATFEEIMALEGIVPALNPWSSTGHQLIFVNGSVQLFDADSAASSPPVVTAASLQDIVWSPDGTWIAGREVQGAGHRRFVAARLTGGATVEIAADVGHGHLIWASNGKIYYWMEEERHLVTYDPPPAWQQSHGPLAAFDQYLQFMRDPQTPWIIRLRADGDSLDTSWFSGETTGATRLFLLDAIEGGRSVLVKTESVVAVTDADAHVRSQFGRAPTSVPPDMTRTGFQPFSASEDGKLVVGTTELSDGHRLLESKIVIGSVEGTWMSPVGGITDGEGPHLSSDGKYLEFIGLRDRRIHVGALKLTGIPTTK